MYKVLLGMIDAPDDVTPDFIRDGMSDIGGERAQAVERLALMRVSAKCTLINVQSWQCSYQIWYYIRDCRLPA